LLQPGLCFCIDLGDANRGGRRRRRVRRLLLDRCLWAIARDRAHQRLAVAREIVKDADGIRLEHVERNALVGLTWPRNLMISVRACA